MAVLAAPSDIGIKDGWEVLMKMAAVKIYRGGAIGVVSGVGYATPMVIATSGISFLGVAEETLDNSTGSAGDKWIRVRRRGLAAFTGSGLTVANIGNAVYFVSGSDDNTVSTTASAVFAGYLAAVDSNGVCWVAIDGAVADYGNAGSGAVTYGDVLSGGTYQSIETMSATQNYALGARRVLTGDGRVFKYAEVGTGGWTPGYGAFHTLGVALGENIHVTAAVGATTIVMEEASIAANDWAGGLIVMGHGSGATTQNRRIVSNTASAASTNHVTVTLDYPLTAELTGGSSYVEIMKNEYGSLSVSNNEFSSVAGVPVAVGTVGQFGWVQTWGPCWIVPGGAGTPGSTAHERTVYFVGDGSINGDVGLADPTTEPERRQVAGYIIQRDSSGAGGPPFVMLQLCP